MHVGGSPLQLDKSWSDNGKPLAKTGWVAEKM